jgi:protein-disulfide isomerase
MMRQLCGVGAMCGLLLGIVAGPAAAEDARGAPDLPVERIEEIVRDYLLREPEVVGGALKELQPRQQVAATERQKAAIAANEALLFDDPATPFGGDADAQVTLVEFFDYRCTYCRRVVGAMQALLENEDGLKIVFKDLPVLGEESVQAARAALASREQDGYVPFHFALMQAADLSHAGIMAIARDVGLDAERLAQDMQAPAIQEGIDANYALADRLGIDGTPAFVIGDQLIPGAIGEAQLKQLIDQQRAG